MTSGGNGLGAGRLGVLGVGHIGGAIARGLLHAGLAPGRILLAPRGADAAGLGLEAARDNSDLVARADVVFLCVRSPLAVDVVAGLPWRRGQLLISTCAGVSRRTLAAAAGAPDDSSVSNPTSAVSSPPNRLLTVKKAPISGLSCGRNAKRSSSCST